MAKGAATETALGGLHSKLADVFSRVLETYMKRLDALDTVNMDDLGEEMLAQLLEDGAMPNPAMLNAIAAFLKQNEIRFDDEKIDKLGALETALAERQAKRQNIAQLRTLKVVGDE